jgi:GxxExxY protein
MFEWDRAALKNLQFVVEQRVPVVYKGLALDSGYRLDVLVEQRLVVEVKAVERLLPVHSAQVITYLRLTAAKQALLINFNCARLVHGLKSFLG